MWLQAHKWSCHVCDSSCDLDSIEAALLHVVQQRAKLFQLQDLVCVKCKNVSVTSLMCLELSRGSRLPLADRTSTPSHTVQHHGA